MNKTTLARKKHTFLCKIFMQFFFFLNDQGAKHKIVRQNIHEITLPNKFHLICILCNLIGDENTLKRESLKIQRSV